jgi:hypothetical protein
MSLIYALVARGNDAVLCNYTPFTGNFEQIALDVLKRLNLSRMYAQFGTAKYNFYSYIKENYVFLVMVETEVSKTLCSTKCALPFPSFETSKISFSIDIPKRKGTLPSHSRSRTSARYSKTGSRSLTIKPKWTNSACFKSRAIS